MLSFFPTLILWDNNKWNFINFSKQKKKLSVITPALAKSKTKPKKKKEKCTELTAKFSALCRRLMYTRAWLRMPKPCRKEALRQWQRGSRLGLEGGVSQLYHCDRHFSTGNKARGHRSATVSQTVPCTRMPTGGQGVKLRPGALHLKPRKGVFFNSPKDPTTWQILCP